MTDRTYVGEELDVFAHATRWKRYVASLLKPCLHGAVLEVGAGIGATTREYWNESVTRWLCLEPDASLAARIETDLAGVAVRVGALADLERDAERFDAILYVDVLEHIRDDRGELARAARLLRPQGRIAVVAPAHGFLFSPFDQAIGHFRRYDKRGLRAIAPAALVEERIVYLDSVGMLLSLLNRLLLRSPQPRLKQILFWDRVVVPLSVRLDPCLFHALGKSVVAVWRLDGGVTPARA
jgi:SAM-dependent methyltransferase